MRAAAVFLLLLLLYVHTYKSTQREPSNETETEIQVHQGNEAANKENDAPRLCVAASQLITVAEGGHIGGRRLCGAWWIMIVYDRIAVEDEDDNRKGGKGEMRTCKRATDAISIRVGRSRAR